MDKLMFRGMNILAGTGGGSGMGPRINEYKLDGSITEINIGHIQIHLNFANVTIPYTESLYISDLFNAGTAYNPATDTISITTQLNIQSETLLSGEGEIKFTILNMDPQMATIAINIFEEVGNDRKLIQVAGIAESNFSILKNQYIGFSSVIDIVVAGAWIRTTTNFFTIVEADINNMSNSATSITLASGAVINKNTITHVNASLLTPTSLPDNFLRGFSVLNNVRLPDTFNTIGSGFLQECTVLNSKIILPNNIVSIGNDFMASCTSFNSVVEIPTTVQSIGSGFLLKCSALVGGIIPNFPYCRSIGANFLSGCTRFNAPINLPLITTFDLTHLGFMNGCTQFNSPINLSGLMSINMVSTTTIANFWCDLTSFNNTLNLNSLQTITYRNTATTGNTAQGNFMTGWSSFNTSLTFPSLQSMFFEGRILSAGNPYAVDGAFSNWTSFNQNIYFPVLNSITVKGEYFYYGLFKNWNSFTGTMYFDALSTFDITGGNTENQHIMSTTSNTSIVYTSGLRIGGDPNSRILIQLRLPNRTATPFRSLITTVPDIQGTAVIDNTATGINSKSTTSTLPAGWYAFDMIGGGGGSSFSSGGTLSGAPGSGGRATGKFYLNASKTYTAIAGGGGGAPSRTSTSYDAGGGGGGASGLFISGLGHIIAGGGGGAGGGSSTSGGGGGAGGGGTTAGCGAGGGGGAGYGANTFGGVGGNGTGIGGSSGVDQGNGGAGAGPSGGPGGTGSGTTSVIATGTNGGGNGGEKGGSGVWYGKNGTVIGTVLPFTASSLWNINGGAAGTGSAGGPGFVKVYPLT